MISYGRTLPIVGTEKHDVVYSVVPLDASRLRRGANRIMLRSDTEHHGIDVHFPSPALVVRARRLPPVEGQKGNRAPVPRWDPRWPRSF
jgi:hypothetical protein